MKILQVTPYYLPHTGGIERYVDNLSKYLKRNGHQVEIHTSNIPKAPNYEEVDGIVIRRFQSLCSPLRNPMAPRFFFPSLNELDDFDLIHAHMLYSSAAIYAITLKRRLGIPLLFTHHGRMRFENFLGDSIVNIYEKFILPKIISEANGLVALSNSDSEFLGNFEDKNKITVIPNGLDIHSVERLLSENKDSPIGIDESHKAILFVGRLVPHKGAEYLLKAIKIISKELRQYGVILIIIGNGPQLFEIKQFVFENKIDDLVIFTGQITETQKIDHYRKSHIFVLPSLSEGFPTTILEAMYFGVPVIATNIPVMEQYFSDLAILVPPRDSERLAEAILYLMKNPDICQKLSIKGKEKVMSEYTWDNIVQQYLKLFDDLQSKKQQGRK